MKNVDALARKTGPTSWLPGSHEAALTHIGQLQVDSAVLFERVANTLKLLGDQYLARVYRLASQRFHLEAWDASIIRKLQNPGKHLRKDDRPGHDSTDGSARMDHHRADHHFHRRLIPPHGRT